MPYKDYEKEKAHKRNLYKKDPVKHQEKSRKYYKKDPARHRERVRQWQLAHPDKVKEYNKVGNERNKEKIKLWRQNRPEYDKMRRYAKYGISLDEFTIMVNKQGGKCAICENSCENLTVDHDHATGQVRDLLCGNCNSGLGMFKDDKKRLASAMLYLEKHGNLPLTSSNVLR